MSSKKTGLAAALLLSALTHDTLAQSKLNMICQTNRNGCQHDQVVNGGSLCQAAF